MQPDSIEGTRPRHYHQYHSQTEDFWVSLTRQTSVHYNTVGHRIAYYMQLPSVLNSTPCLFTQVKINVAHIVINEAVPLHLAYSKESQIERWRRPESEDTRGQPLHKSRRVSSAV